jgi:hypothetical protein
LGALPFSYLLFVVGASLGKDLYSRLLALEHGGEEFRALCARLLRRSDYEKTYGELTARRTSKLRLSKHHQAW